MKPRSIYPGQSATAPIWSGSPDMNRAKKTPPALKSVPRTRPAILILCFSVLLAAGLKGVEEGLEPPAPAEGNVYHMTDEQRKKLGIGTLPASLNEALQLMEKSKLIREALGEHTFNAFLENKRMNGINSAPGYRLRNQRISAHSLK